MDFGFLIRVIKTKRNLNDLKEMNHFSDLIDEGEIRVKNYPNIHHISGLDFGSEAFKNALDGRGQLFF